MTNTIRIDGGISRQRAPEAFGKTAKILEPINSHHLMLSACELTTSD